MISSQQFGTDSLKIVNQILYQIYISVDEQFFSTKARYPFTQYIANKPNKFGIKFWLAVDYSSKYLVNEFPYLGKDDHWPANQPVLEEIVLRLMDPYLDKGHNVTTNNFFTSGKLSEKLENKKTIIVRTMNRIRRDIHSKLSKVQCLPIETGPILINYLKMISKLEKHLSSLRTQYYPHGKMII